MDGWGTYYAGIAQGLGKGEALYRALRQRISEGLLTHGDRLPSTRETAKILGLSRGTVIIAYESLIAEGYVESVPGGYTKVSAKFIQQGASAEGALPAISKRGQAAIDAARKLKEREAVVHVKDEVDPIDLRPVEHVHSLFPHEAWRRCLRAAVRSWSCAGARSGAPMPSLQQAIAAHLMRWRGVHASPERIIVTNGSQHALMLLASLFVDEGDRVLLETPGYVGIRAAVLAAGGVPELFAADEEAALQEALLHTSARLAIVTPNRQFPTGRTMGASARAALLAWAKNREAFVVEDDFDSDFGFGGKRFEPLQAADRSGRVIYIGSFSRTMSPNLRIGYMLLPERLVSLVQAVLAVNGQHAMPRIEQSALALLMQSGEYERHLRRVNREIRRKAQEFCNILQEYAGHLFNWYADDIGFHLYARWRQAPEQYVLWSQEVARLGVLLRDGDTYIDEVNVSQSAIFGIAHVDENRWREACLRMRNAWDTISATYI
ncbi:MocR-like pyridoxine biosynthesis transcription factor PdxR [Paenibacillus marinisediminis]